MILTKKTTPEFLRNGGEMGELIRTMDWSNSSLGDPGQWSQSLRTSVSICLNSRFPMLILWGKCLAKIYNDGYREILGAKHPRSMGAGGADVWPEVWHIIAPMLQGVLDSGEPTWSEDQLFIIERNGYPEECYFTFSYSAIRDEDGKTGGVFCAVSETTKRVFTERHLARQLNNLFIQAPVALCLLRGANFVVETANEKMLDFWGRKQTDVLNKPIFDALPEVRAQGFKELLENVYNKGERFVADELPVNLVRNGKTESVFVKFVYEPLREEDGAISGVMVLAHEITDHVIARKRLEESEAFNRTVLESSPDCLKVIDGEGRLLYMNSNGLCALEIDDFTGFKNKYWWQLWNDENQPVVKAAITKALDGEIAYFQAGDHTVKGSLKWWDVVVSPVLEEGAEKKVAHIIAVSRDITQQKQEALKLKESEAHFRMMADLMPAKISNADTVGNITYFNKSWLDYAELSFEELRDFGYHQIMHPDEIEGFQRSFLEAAATGTILEMEMRFRNKAGDYKWHLNLASPVKDENGNIKMWVGVTTEIQQQKEQTEKLENAVAERTLALQKANVEIEKRSADLIVANNQLVFQNEEKEKRAAELLIANRTLLLQNEEKEKRALELIIANKELEAFTYISSHDLQEPLRKINTFITLLFEKENQHLSDKGKDYLKRIDKASKRMQTLIEDLLDYSRIGDKELNFESIALTDIIDESIADLSDIIQEKNAVITVDTIGKLSVNQSQFRQLMDNLIGNTLKFSKPGIAPTLSISSKIDSGGKFKNVSLSPEKNYCHISFSDNGIGFDPQYKDRIFEVFQRLYGKDEYDGTGIGLAIVKKIVENHHGVITATGVINEGARFDIYLPV